MRSWIVGLYFYAVLFVSLLISIILLSTILWGVVRIVAPQLTIPDYEYNCYISDGDYNRCHNFDRPVAEGYSSASSLGSADIKNKKVVDKEEAFKNLLTVEKRRGIRSIIQNIIPLILVGFVGLMHLRVGRRKGIL